MFYTKFGEDFPSIFITVHFQEGSCTLKGFKEWGEEVIQSAHLNRARVVPKLFQTSNRMSQHACKGTRGMIPETKDKH